MNKLIHINEIDIKESPKVRAELNHEVAAEYGAMLKAKEKLPEPVLFQGKGEKFYRLGDGLHRITGAGANGIKMLVCEVREGGYEEALAFALTRNTTHGLRRTQADRRRCVTAALEQWPKLSDTEIGKRCQVDHKTVGAIRKTLEGDIGEQANSSKRVTKSGTIRSATRSIGNSLKGEAEALPLKPKNLKDSTGFPIPEELYPLWMRIPECQNLIDNLTMVKKEVVRADKDKDPMFLEVNVDGVVSVIEDLIVKLKVLIPYAVCTSCQGKLHAKCSLCHGRGLVSKFRWDLVPQEVKDIRAKELKEAK